MQPLLIDSVPICVSLPLQLHSPALVLFVCHSRGDLNNTRLAKPSASHLPWTLICWLLGSSFSWCFWHEAIAALVGHLVTSGMLSSWWFLPCVIFLSSTSVLSMGCNAEDVVFLAVGRAIGLASVYADWQYFFEVSGKDLS